MDTHHEERPSTTRRRDRSLILAVLLSLAGLASIPDLSAQVPQADKEAQRDQLRRAQLLHEELLNQAQAQAERLAEYYRRNLGEQVGRQTREQFQRLIEAAERKTQQKTEQADRELVEVGRTAEQLARELANIETRLLRQQQPVDAALKKSDNKALTQARQQVKNQRGEVQSLLTRVRTMEAVLGRAIARLTGEGPRFTAAWKTDIVQHAATGSKHAQAMVNAVGEGKPAEAVTALKSASEQLQRFAEWTRRAHAAFEVLRAADGAEAFARTTSTAAESLRLFAGAAAAAVKTRDPEMMPDVVRRMQLATHHSALTLHESRRFSEALLRATTSLKGLPQGLGKAVPHALKALGELKKGQEHLVREEPDKAGEKMAAVASHLKDLAKELQEMRRRLGLEGDRDATVLAREVGALFGVRLPRHVEEQFTRMHVEKVLPKLLSKAREAAEKSLPANTPALRELREGALKELEKMLGRGMIARVRPAEQFAEAAGERLVQLGKQGEAGKKSGVLGATENTLRQAIDRKIALLATGGTIQVKFLLPVLKDVPKLPPAPKEFIGIPRVAEDAIPLDGDLSDRRAARRQPAGDEKHFHNEASGAALARR